MIRGGRPVARGALYMAAISAIRSNAVIRGYYERLRVVGKKPFKVAIVVCMRKLLLYLNGLCASNRAEFDITTISEKKIILTA